MKLGRVEISSSALSIVILVVQILFICLTILRYGQTKAQGHLYLLVPMILQAVWCVLSVKNFDPAIRLYVSVAACFITLEIVVYHSILWARSMRKHIGTITTGFFRMAFYFWMLVFIPSAIIISVGLTSLLNINPDEDAETNPKLTTNQIIYLAGCVLGVVGSLFGFFSSISYIMLLPKSAARYGNQKKRQAVRLMFMYVFTGIATSSLIGSPISAIALLLVYLVTLVPKNAMQNYTATPEECIKTVPMSLPVSGQHVMPVVIQVPH
ncbi:hypothetical protein BDF22DRAFT_306689 [Syncephalis plumigaleata]|nr:hypothetical protein BDF22DRAFT_306689 [Syncephalis plumigaleata]